MRNLILILLSSVAVIPFGATVLRADPMSTPAMSGPLTANPDPMQFDAGPLGDIHITGAVSGLALWQDNPVPGDHSSAFDVSNAQIFVQKTDGLLQFFVQVGDYAIPALGAGYIHSNTYVGDTFGVVPEAYVKLAPTGSFSIEAGKLPTLIGAESNFTFENMDIERGLLFNQTPTVSRGVQANYSSGPIAVSVSVNDGYYSNRFNWISGSAAWTIDGANTLSFVGGANVGTTPYSSFTAPQAQNNGAIFDLIYTYNAAPWNVQPYLQYGRVPANASLGFARSSETYGVGLLGTYVFTPSLSLSGRVEYESSAGGVAAPNLLYGPGSKAWSATLTPTWQHKLFFVRGEVSYVGLSDVTPGFGLGSGLDGKSQVRGLLETGINF
jgi:Putative beta-barrel porin-2, OmpL-like. bbp2